MRMAARFISLIGRAGSSHRFLFPRLSTANRYSAEYFATGSRQPDRSRKFSTAAHGRPRRRTDRTRLANRPICLLERVLGCAGVGEIAQQRIWQWVDHGGGIAVWESRRSE